MSKNNAKTIKEEEINNSDEDCNINIFDNPGEEGNNLYKKYSEEISQNIENFELDEEWIIYCSCCGSAIRLKFKSKDLFNIKCEKEWAILNSQHTCKTYVKPYRKSAINIKYLTCQRHKKQFEQYCTNCKKNLCKDCIIENYCNKHDRITLITEKIAYLKEYLLKNKNHATNLNDKDYYFLRLLEVLINTHENYPNYRTLKSLESASKLLEYNEKGKEENEDIKTLKSGKLIKDKKDLRSKNWGYPFNIYLNNSNFKNLKHLSKRWLKNNCSLIKLTLAENDLNNIKFLKFADLNNLKHLDLSRNKLKDNNIKHLADLKCNKLENLYLHSNRFTDYTIFNLISKKFDLKIFFIGFNRFEKNIDKLGNCNFSSLINIGLNYVFNKDTFHNIKKFYMPKIQYLHIQKNEINSLYFFKDMKLQNVKVLYLNGNELKNIDIKDLNIFTNLEEIILDSNSIYKVINIEQIKNMKKLKSFSIEDNNLEQKIKNDLKEMEKFKENFIVLV